MTFDPILYRLTTRQQWEDYALGWSDWAPHLESWLGEATPLMLDPAPVLLSSAAECTRFEGESFGALHQMLGSLAADEQQSVWEEIEQALSQFETADGFVGPCDLVVASGTR